MLTHGKQKMADLKKIACDIIDENKEDFCQLSQEIWENPELAYKEFHAHDAISNFLEKQGFEVTRKYKGINTSFCAKFGHKVDTSGPHLAILCEYDALPGIGHACGHNLIAELGVAAGVAVKHVLATKPLGKLTVLGTPAEEGLCGKDDLIKAGAFDGITAAMMAHPSQFTLARPKYVSMTPVKIRYQGKASHASSYPWEGVNALDAAVMCYNHISCLRQQMKPTWRVHGVISNGGEQPNIIPEEAELQYYLRTPSESELDVLKSKVVNCIKGAAQATGCTVDYEFSEKHYYCLHSNETMAAAFEENAKSIGVEFETRDELVRKYGGSTDMGNVSHIVPSIHPKFFIGTTASNHSKKFTEAAGDPKAQPYTLNVAKGLAMTAVDILTQPDLVEKMKQDFKKDIAL